jgi:hypothetical protein
MKAGTAKALTVGDQVAVLIGEHGKGGKRQHDDRIDQLLHGTNARSQPSLQRADCDISDDMARSAPKRVQLLKPNNDGGTPPGQPARRR